MREQLFYLFAEAKQPILSMAREQQSLEDVFLTLTGGEAHAQAASVKGGGAK
jgi:hypothetical protein